MLVWFMSVMCYGYHVYMCMYATSCQRQSSTCGSNFSNVYWCDHAISYVPFTCLPTTAVCQAGKERLSLMFNVTTKIVNIASELQLNSTATEALVKRGQFGFFSNMIEPWERINHKRNNCKSAEGQRQNGREEGGLITVALQPFLQTEQS